MARKRSVAEYCEMCARELLADHQHLIDPDRRKLVCACDACAILFTAQEGTKLRRVPREVRYLPNFQMPDALWGSLLIPIELAFFFENTPERRVVAFYPSPAGATESLLALETWENVVNDNRVLTGMLPDVEALLVNRVGSTRGVEPAYFIAPIDECFKLVGLIRMHWRGLSGGTEVWREINGFFSALKEKASVPKELARETTSA